MKFSPLILFILACLFFSVPAVQAQLSRKEQSMSPEMKYIEAKKYFDKKVYYKAIPLLEQLMGLYKGSQNTEEIYYMYCICQYEDRNYVLAAYHFKNFFEQYPTNEHAEDALYKYAWCFYYNSPEASLDQEDSKKALEALQYFINNFPNSSRVKEANEIMDKIYNRLEKKALQAADLYYKTQSYRAAAHEYTNVLDQYPSIRNAEEIRFLILKSQFRFAELSITDKKPARYMDVLESYKAYSLAYPNGKYQSEAAKFNEEATMGILNASFSYALSVSLDKREKFFGEMLKKYTIFAPLLKSQEHLTEANRLKEQASFLIIRTNYQLAQDNSGTERHSYYDRTLKSYFSFVDAYKESKYLKEAEKMFHTASENLKKLNNNG